MIGKIITLDNDSKYLILLENTLDNKKFVIGVKIISDKYTNDFKLFLEKKKDDSSIFEEIQDEELLKVIVNSYILDKMERYVWRKIERVLL